MASSDSSQWRTRSDWSWWYSWTSWAGKDDEGDDSRWRATDQQAKSYYPTAVQWDPEKRVTQEDLAELRTYMRDSGRRGPAVADTTNTSAVADRTTTKPAARDRKVHFESDMTAVAVTSDAAVSQNESAVANSDAVSPHPSLDARLLPLRSSPAGAVPCWDAAFFKQRRPEVEILSKDMHNWALKNLADQMGDLTQPHDDLIVCAFERYTFNEVIHPHAGTARGAEYHFGPGTFPWTWFDLISSLRDEDIDKVCHSEGPAGVRSRGLVSCRVSVDTTSFDIGSVRKDKLQSQHEGKARRYKSKKPMVVDFVFMREDGVGFALHPKHKDNKIGCKTRGWTSDTDAPIPSKGLYGTDGPGTFKSIMSWNHIEPLRFDMESVKEAQWRQTGKQWRQAQTDPQPAVASPRIGCPQSQPAVASGVQRTK